jgi:CHAT domain-containing protein
MRLPAVKFAVLLLGCANAAQGQEMQRLLRDAESAIKTRQFDEAIASAAEVLERVDSMNDRATWLHAHNVLGLAYIKTRKFDQALSKLTKARSIGERHFQSNDSLISDTYYLLGIYHDQKGRGDESIDFHTRALALRVNRFGPNHSKVSDSYKGLGEVYFFTIFDLKNARDNFVKSIEILERQPYVDPYELYSGYFNLAQVNRRSGDIDRALTFAFKAFSVIHSNPAYEKYLERCYTLLGDIYFSKAEYEKSVEYLIKGIEQSIKVDGKDNYSLILKMRNLGVSYVERKDFAAAINAFRESLRVYRKHDQHDVSLGHRNFLFLGWAYHKSGSLDSAKKYFRKSLALQLTENGFKHPKTSEIYDYMAKLFKDFNQVDSAAVFSQRSLNAAIKEFDNQNIFASPDISSIRDRYELFTKFATKGSILHELFKRNHQLKVLHAAHSSFQLADQLMTQNRNSYQREEAKLFFADHYHSIYENAIDVAYQLYDQTKNITYLENAWMYMEKNKAFLLAESLQRAEMFSGAGIPDSIRHEERSIVSQLARYRDELESSKAKNDIAAQEKIQAELFQLTRQQESLTTSISQRYPNYFHVKYTSLASLSDIARVAAKKDAIVLQYFWSEHFVYAIAVSEKNVVIRKIENSPRIQSAIELYRGEMQPGASGAKHDYNTFVTNAELLFRTLVMPLVSDYKGEKIVVIRDGPLLTIPFETLLFSKRGGENNYKTLEYLIRKYVVSYAHSGNLFVRNAEGKERSADHGVLGFSFSSSMPNPIQEESVGEQSELPGTARELKAISEYFEGDFFQGSDATEQKFKALASGYDILHLAVHGRVDEDKPLSGSLLFKHSLDTVDNGELNLAELYNLRLNARLAVLSACESGVGKVFKGEGVFSISRGFDYAGCPSTIITLWKIGDQASSTIMANFYEELKSGEQIDVALRNAKLRYLETSHSLLTHPTYWAAFVPVGNMDAVKESKLALWATLAAVALTLGVFIVMKKFQARRKQSEMRKREMAHQT